MEKLGITPEINNVEILQSDPKGTGNILVPVPIFREHDKGIEIVVYTLNRTTIRIEGENSRMKRNWSIIRLEKPVVMPDGQVKKYHLPKGHGSYPFFPPNLLKKFDSNTEINTLFLTEGYFKAFKGDMHGIDVVGLTSITHLKDREKGTLHQDILFLIKQCKVKRVVWLTDGDCLDITGKEITDTTDLFKRPNGFYQSVATFKQLLDDYEVEKYFVHIDIDQILSNGLFSKAYSSQANEAGRQLTRDDVKGLDDLLISFPEKHPEIIADLYRVSTPGGWFARFNVTTGISAVWKYFRLDNPTGFYLFHVERRKDLKGREFVFRGTKYSYNEQDGECKVLVPGKAKDYFRVGNNYYKFILVPNKWKQLERKFEVRLKSTIVDDHGKDFIKHIPKYESFCNVPDHVTYHQVLDGCFNVYNPLEHIPDEEECTEADCPTIINYLKHIFGENIVKFKHPKTHNTHEYRNYELGLDYIQILYQQPAEKLPIVCLVSKENNTGKSTLGKLLKQIFSSNCAIVGNQDLAGDFNAHWSTKLIVICDETKIDKQAVVEKVKSLSTADKIMMNAKGKDQVEIDCFIKFMFITNNEDNFITVTDEDIRYWVIKVPVIREENPNILSNMIEEIPAFLSFLNKRRLITEKLNRMWFHPSIIRTEALRKVVEWSKPQIVKEITSKIKTLFFETGEERILMTKTAILEDLLGRQKYEDFYLENVLKQYMKLEQYHKFETPDKRTYETQDGAIEAVMRMQNLEVANSFAALAYIQKKTITHRFQYPKLEKRMDMNTRQSERVMVWVKDIGRPYIFHRKDFLTQEEIDTNLPDPELASMASSPVSSASDSPNYPLNDLPF